MSKLVETTIEPLIINLRGKRVILDADLARLYGVTTAALNQAVRRNADRFPDDFAFKLAESEKRELITNCDRFKNLKHSTSLPTAFAEHGAVMAANMVNSKHAIRISVLVVRAFVRMREALAANAEIVAKLGELEQRVDGHDASIQGIVSALKRLMDPAVPPKRRIGFGTERE